MRLYKGISKRQYKKRVGRYYRKLLYGATLKPGDLISACRGYNERIAAIAPERWNTRSGTYVWNFDIDTTGGGFCSLIHCCTFPVESLETILKYWQRWNTPEGIEYLEKYAGDKTKAIVDAVIIGDCPFTETGELLPQYQELVNVV